MKPTRLVELLGVLSLAAEAAINGSVGEHGLRTAIFAAHVAGELGLSDAVQSDAFTIALLRYIGCVGDADIAAEVLGDEAEFGGKLLGLDFGDPTKLLPALLRLRWQGELGQTSGIAAVAQTLLSLPKMATTSRTHCEVAAMLARELGVGDGVVHGLDQVFERWNGKGAPNGLKGDAIDAAVRVAQIAEVAVLAAHFGDADDAARVLRTRAGKAVDPKMAEHIAAQAGSLLGCVDAPSIWDALLNADPSKQMLQPDETARALEAIADFADLKSQFTRNHSRGVADLASRAARNLKLSSDEIDTVRAAGLLHDIGRVGISVTLWDKAGTLTESERERVRVHAYLTERVLARLSTLAPAAAIASLDHERLDGSGYHRRLPSTALTESVRLLAAADAYHAMVESRAYRAALTPDEAAVALRKEVREGKHCGTAVESVLGAAGHQASSRPELPAGLTAREVEVLKLAAQGLTNKEIASELAISTKTAGHHLQHIYGKIGVTTRSAAALFAMKHDLLRTLA
jgi:HD-GYP domain-containing protein (c-di-GMP phosphodiesterase class II)